METMQSNMQHNGEPLNKNLLVVCGTIVIISLIVVGGVLYSKSMPSNPTVVNQVPQQNNNNPPTGPVKVSIDDDAVLGSQNAPVTLIEFSDYECPFCKRHFVEVYPEIKKNYVDTGKVKIVFRDFIAVQGHNPLATSQALAAECAADQGGDSVYFKYHDELFKRTTSNGNGMTLAQLPAIAKDLGLNVATFQQCLDSQKFKDEVAKDNADAAKAGINGTPSFFVGKSTPNGEIDGTVIIGAQPYAAFQAAIDQALAAK